jgi:hypothetical protein
MLQRPSLRCFTVLSWLAGSACAGMAQTQEPPPEQSDGKEQAPGEVDVVVTGNPGTSDPGDVPSAPEGSEFPDDTCCAAAALVVTPVSNDVCAFHEQEDRVVLHHRDDERSVCVDFIMVRVGSGGIAPEGLSLPWDWGVGHASSYPCTPDGEIVSGETPTTLSEITGSIGMGGGLTGLPASLMLHLQLRAPAVTATEAGESYAFDGVVDVAATCDASAPWTSQPLNLRAAPVASVKGCRYSGALDRLTLHQDDPSSSICTDLRLVHDVQLENLIPGLSLPAGWQVEEMSSYSCSAAQAVSRDATFFTQAVGSVSFGGSVNGLPEYVWLDVSMSVPEQDTSVPAELVISTQHLRSTDSVDVTGGCGGAW